MTHILTTSIGSNGFNVLSKLILYFVLEDFERFIDFMFMFQQVNITISSEIITNVTKYDSPFLDTVLEMFVDF